MSNNRMQWAAARSHAVAAVFGGSSMLGGTVVSTSAPAAVVGARKPRITDAGYAQGGPCAWSPPV